jgi:hypothetical protein
MDATGIADFLHRDWALLKKEKQRYWAERLAAVDPEQCMEIGEALRQEALAVHPDWPSPEERLKDLKAHEALCELMRRATAKRPG